jgi:hypothetical protein
VIRRFIPLFLLATFAGVAGAVPVTLFWDPPAAYAPEGYVVGFGPSSGTYTTTLDVGLARSLTADLAAGQTYYFSVRAYTVGDTSEWASEVAVVELGVPAPGSVAVSPIVGLWDNSDEPGTGYSLDFKHGVLVVLVFSYAPSGDAQWYIASGPLDGATFTGRLDKFVGGPCVSCAFAGGPMAAGSDGDIRIVFSSPTSATVYLPGGKVTPIRPAMF